MGSRRKVWAQICATLRNWCWRKRPRVSRPAEPAYPRLELWRGAERGGVSRPASPHTSARKQGVAPTYEIGRAASSRISPACKLVSGTCGASLPEGSGNGRLVEDLDVASGTSAVGMRYASRLVDAAAGRVVDVSWPAGGERRGGSPPVERRGEAEQVLLELWQLAGALQRLGAHQQRDRRLDIPVLAWGWGGAGGGVQGSRTSVAGGLASV